MTHEKAMERLIALLARSASTHEEEARTSAYLACKIIREYKFEIKDNRSGAQRASDLNKAYKNKCKQNRSNGV